MNRRRFVATGLSVGAVGTAGCLSGFGSEQPDPAAVTEAVFTAMNTGDIDEVSDRLHPESEIDLAKVGMSVYETHNIRTPDVMWLEPDGTPREDVNTTPSLEAVFDVDDRTLVTVIFGIYERNYHVASSYELRRTDEWLLYDEVSGDARAFSADPFPGR